MSVRPFPSRDRALRQVMRRHRNEIPAAFRTVQPGGLESAERMRAVVAALPRAPAYVLSTRRSG
ncbi:hypothetical protein ACIGCZ_38540 [Streptomyces nigra]|uniref:hypothetical protein n=1 Tax=Streptomyces nigra TaxID=1827580 RepID=UPI0037D09E1B